MTNFVIHIQQIDANIVADDGVDVIPKFQHRTKSRMNCSKFAPQQTVSSVIGLDTTTIIFWYSNKLSGSNLFHSITLEISVRVFLCVSEIDNVMIDTNREKQKKNIQTTQNNFLGDSKSKIDASNVNKYIHVHPYSRHSRHHTHTHRVILYSEMIIERGFGFLFNFSDYIIFDCWCRRPFGVELSTYLHTPHTPHTNISSAGWVSGELSVVRRSMLIKILYVTLFGTKYTCIKSFVFFLFCSFSLLSKLCGKIKVPNRYSFVFLLIAKRKKPDICVVSYLRCASQSNGDMYNSICSSTLSNRRLNNLRKPIFQLQINQKHPKSWIIWSSTACVVDNRKPKNDAW